LTFFAAAGLAIANLGAESVPTRSDEHHGVQETSAPTPDFGKLPLSFEPNVGQAPQLFDSVARGPGYAVYLAQDEMQIVLRPAAKQEARQGGGPGNTLRKRERGTADAGQATVLRFKLRDANTGSKRHFTEPLPGSVNYIRGNDPAAWHQDVPTYAKFQYDAIYPGIDLVYHGNQRQVEHDFVIAAGADPRAIAWEISGADRIEMSAEGDLLLHTAAGVLRMPKACAYQDLPTGRTAVAVNYELQGTNAVRFALGAYEAGAALVIDPVLYYSTFLGGSAYDEAYGIAVDANGNAYVTGTSFSTNFPVASALQPAKAADGDAFVAKFNPAGSALIFCTYLGGSGYDEGDAVAVDGTGAVYVAGVTYSTNFPTMNPNQAANGGNGDAFLTKLSATGAALVYSTYHGYAGYDEAAAVVVNSAGIAFIAGSSEEPTLNDMDAFVVRYTANGLTQTYNARVGGSGSDAAYGMAIDASLNVYLTGRTESRDFPTTAAAFSRTYGGAGDAFVCEIDPTATTFVYSTFLGGNRSDSGNAIALDSAKNAYVTGETESPNFPVLTPYQAALKTGGDAFVTKIKAGGAALSYSTFFGGSNLDYGTGIAVDFTGSAHVTGYTASADFPKYFQSQAAIGGGGDAFVARFSTVGTTLVYSTFLGGKDVDIANAIAVDTHLISYVAGYTISTNFPLYLPLQKTFGGVADAFVTKIGNPIVTIVATDASAAEAGLATGQFTISRTGNPAASLIVYLTFSGTATSGVDYQTIASPVTIPAGSLSTTITVTPIDDQIWEGPETVVATLTPNVRYTIGVASAATVTIADNEVKPTVTVTATDASAAEPSNTGQFTITRNTSTVGPLTVNFTIGGTATNGVDYNTIATSVTIPAGSASTTVTVTPKDDTATEGNETVILTLATSALYTNGSPATATVTIADNDGAPTVTIAALDATATEGSATDTGSFRVTRTGATTQALTVYYTVSGTATRAVDYSNIATSVVIPAGSTTATILITALNDTLVEGDESVVLTLSANVSYTMGSQNTATVTIIDDETGPVNQTVTITATDASASEAGQQTGQYTFTRVGSTAAALTVSYTRSGTATFGTDYTLSGATGSIVIPAGSSTAILTLTPIDDLLVEGNETAVITITASSAYTIGQLKSATVTIIDDDTVKPTVTVVATDASAAEAGLDTGTYTFTRTGGSLNVALVVNYTHSGTATFNTDYTGLSTSVTIPAGSTTATVTLTPVDDLIVEGNETAIVTLSANSIYTIGSPSTATVTIADNDTASTSTVTIVATDPNASEPGTDTGTFTFTRSGGSTAAALQVSYTIGGNATNGVDYTSIASTVTIPVGSTTATVVIKPIDDNFFDGAETVDLALTASGLYNVGNPSTARVTIADDEPTTVVSIQAIDATASEPGTDTGAFRITRTGTTTQPLTVNYAVTGTADNGVDYTTLPGSVIIPVGATTADVVVKPIDDAITEVTETVILTITGSTQYAINNPNNATVNIVDNDSTNAQTVTVQATDPTTAELNAQTGQFTFTRVGSTTSALAVHFAVTGTATPGSDYNGIGTTITIPAGAASVTATITPIDDLLIEGNETVIVTLASDATYTIGGANTATVTITDDDTVKPTVTVAATDAVAAEAASNPGTFTFTRNGGSLTVPLVVSYVISGTATPGTDYTGLGSTVTIPAGSTTATATFTPIDDLVIDPNETVVVTISTDSVYTIGTANTASITITDNDGTKPVVTIVATDPNASEAGTDTGLFTFTRTGGDTSVSLYVHFTRSGTASSSDYSSPSYAIYIPAGSTTVTATVTPVDDLLIEGDETVIFTIDPDPDNIYTVGTAKTATVTIADNDTAKPTVTVVATDPNASEAGTDTGTFTFTRTGGDTSVDLYVRFTTSGTASNADYSGPSYAIYIYAGHTTATATITPVNDLLIEPSETVIYTISPDPDGVYLVGAANTATVTIADNDTVKPTVTVVATDATASEAGTNTGTFTFTRSGGDLSVPLYVRFTNSGTASTSDYSGAYFAITIPAGSTTVTSTVTATDDLIIEPTETVTLTIDPDPDGIYQIGTANTATVSILDDDTVKPTVTVVATDPDAAEPGATVNNGTFTFTRAGGSLNVALYVRFTTSGTADTYDYSGAYYAVTIPAGSTTVTSDVIPRADTTVEGPETVIVTIDPDPDSIYLVGTAKTATVTIQNAN